MHEPPVLCQAVDHKVAADHVDEVKVERAVDQQIDDFFAAIPPGVDPDVPFGDLQPGGNPDAVHGDVDGGDECRNADLDAVGLSVVGKENAAPVDDDLQKKLDLWQSCQ